jgi:hypothetical protein
VMDEPPPAASASSSQPLEARIAMLEQKLQIKQTALQTILRELDELRARVSAELQS